MLKFSQSTGKIHDAAGVLLGTGQAGQQWGLNNPAAQNKSRIGPLPRGVYTIGPPYTHAHLGPLTMNLTPDLGNEMFGRDAFRIHGFSSTHPELSSEGCIVQHRAVRQDIADHLSIDNKIEVVL